MAAKSLRVRLDAESMSFLAQAAELRRVSISDYVRMVTVEHAKRDVLAARQQVGPMTPEEQLAFWNALNEPVKLLPGNAGATLSAVSFGHATRDHGALKARGQRYCPKRGRIAQLANRIA